MDNTEIEKTMLALQLFEMLQRREIGKGELDIVQNDFNNWNRYDLLIKDESQPKNTHVKLSYIEYLWVRIVDSLNKYGISYAVIRDIKKTLIDETIEQELTEIITTEENIAQVREISEDAADGLEKYGDSPEIDEAFKKHMKSISTTFLLLINYVVVEKKEVKLLVNHSGELDILMEAVDEKGNPITLHSDEDKLIKCSPHLCIPISHLVTKYLQIDALECCTQPPKPITKDEHTLLKIVRGKDYKLLESITVCYNEGNPETLKVKEWKKVKLESRLIEHVQKGTYGEMSCKYGDGQSFYFTNERIYKLNGTE
jgi:hypothetical protein